MTKTPDKTSLVTPIALLEFQAMRRAARNVPL